MLKAQNEPCDNTGEAYAPVSVDLVLNNPNVVLRLADSPDVIEAPSAADLFGKGEGYYLDFPHDPRQPGCGYEEDFKAMPQPVVPVAYAHIATQVGHDQIALQYWLYYYFNDWNNNHESDFEMIQIIFDADTVEEALTLEPTGVGYSQHGGGEYADWNSDKLEREGDHPVVYAAAGSHSNQFENKNYIGRAEEDGVGFGCDDASGESVRLQTEAIVVPDYGRQPGRASTRGSPLRAAGASRCPASSTARPDPTPSAPGRSLSAGRRTCVSRTSKSPVARPPAPAPRTPSAASSPSPRTPCWRLSPNGHGSA